MQYTLAALLGEKSVLCHKYVTTQLLSMEAHMYIHDTLLFITKTKDIIDFRIVS